MKCEAAYRIEFVHEQRARDRLVGSIIGQARFHRVAQQCEPLVALKRANTSLMSMFIVVKVRLSHSLIVHMTRSIVNDAIIVFDVSVSVIRS
jgi:hypothetical protein